MTSTFASWLGSRGYLQRLRLMISPSLSFTIVPGSAYPADVFAEVVNQSTCRFGLQDLACVYYEDKPRPKTRSSVVCAISLDSVPVKAQPKN